MSPNPSQKSSQNKGREPEILETGFKAERRCAGYSQILYKPAHRGNPSQMPSYKEDNGLSQRVHPELLAKIQELVHASTTDPVEIQRLLKHHVHHYMCTGNLPNPTDRAYYPTLDDIRNHVSKAKRAMQLSVLDLGFL